MQKLFISYRREDTEGLTGRVFDRLTAHFGKDSVFMDVDAIPLGVDFVDHLGGAVSQCDILLAMIGEHWLDVRNQEGPHQGQRRLDDPADFVRIEIQAALERNIPVIPVLIGKATMPAQEHLPAELKMLARRNAAEVRPGRDFHGHVDRLIQGIEYLFQKVLKGDEPPGSGHAAAAVVLKKAPADAERSEHAASASALKKPAIEALFPLYGVTLGKTTVAELKKLGGAGGSGQYGEKYHVINGTNFWHDSGDAASNMYIARGVYEMPQPWCQIGFEWDKSYKDWLSFFEKMGWSVKIAKEPSAELWQGRQALSAKLEVTSGELELVLDFNYGNGADVTSPATLYSLTVRLKS